MSSAGDALLGRTLDGRYRVVRRLADGGMATVYLAVDERLGRDVALKVMRPDLAHDDTFVTRFRREARSAASLSHPNVVAVYDQGEDDGHVFLAMEYVSGKTLRDVLTAEGALSPRAALDVAESLLLALAEAHRSGLIHRDVKPENVILGESGIVKVADFGLARAVSSQTVTSSSGMLLGTVSYLAPEQVERSAADARSDVYATGLVLFEMLTGTRAFTGDNPIHVAYQHVHGGVPAPSSRMPNLPTELDDLVAEATSREPDERPTDAGAFLELVRRARAVLSAAALDARPEGDAAQLAAAVPTTTAARRSAPSVGQPAGPGGVATAPAAAWAGPTGRPQHTTALELPSAPLEGVVVGGPPPRRGLWAAVLASAALAAVTAWFFILGPGAAATVPAVAGLTRAAAIDDLQSANLNATVVEDFSEDAAAGQVLRVQPGPGTTVRRGSDVELIVSKGPERYTVPDLVGTSLAEARTRLDQNNLAVGKVTERFDDDVAEGQVISADPAVGASLRRDTAVGLVVSKGRQPLDVPDFTGKPAQEARQALQKLGLKVRADAQQNDDTVPKGSVISQDPRDGTLFRGDTVTLLVSKGPVLVAVPNVIGQQVGDARRLLEQAGFQVKVEEAFGGYFGTVRLQDPAGGQVPRGSMITLTVV
ncbi:MAG: Stk1 family PASTA domain-containing Ser/Thr kinase [Dermatophilaceae bacterium]